MISSMGASKKKRTPTPLGTRIASLRKQMELTQPELAFMVELSPTGLWKIENGETINPGKETLVKLASVLKISLETLLNEAVQQQGIAEERASYVVETDDYRKARKWDRFVEHFKAGDPDMFAEIMEKLPKSEQAIVVRLARLLELEPRLG